MTKPLISVIVPIYNEEKYINRLAASIVSQTYEEVELILVEGGSTDKSANICDSWIEKWKELKPGNSSIQVIHIENKGVSYSRNIGIDGAKGEYISFVDGDDWLEPDALSRMYDAIVSDASDMAGCSFVSRYDGADAKAPENAEEIKSKINKVASKEFLENNIFAGDVHVWGRLYKKSIVGDLRFIEGLTMGEDMLFLIEYVKKCSYVSCLDYAGYNYFRNPKGTMERPFTPAAMDQVKCWEIVREHLGDSDKLRKNMLISVMLTASRIAVLDEALQKDYAKYIKDLHKTLREYKSKGAIKLLDNGYKIKVGLFDLNPRLYIKLYHNHKA